MIQLNDTTTSQREADSGTLIAQASGVGSWETTTYTCPINPIHAALLRTNRVLFLAGSGNNPSNVNDPQGSAVFDLSSSSFVARPTTPTVNGRPIDFFCCGHSFLSDGRLMCVGGTAQYDTWRGLQSALIFDPSTQQWVRESRQPDGARWYPTVITLGDGRIIALSGLDENNGIDTYPEVYSTTNGWQYFSGPPNWSYPTIRYPMYSHLFLMQDGRLFYSGANFFSSAQDNTNVGPQIITVPQIGQPFTQVAVSGLRDSNYVNQAASVLLPPAQDQRVMIIGGGNSYQSSAVNTTKRVDIVNLKAATPTYTAANQPTYSRMHHNAIILPNRTVFVCNGSQAGENRGASQIAPEIYNPATGNWTLAALPRVFDRIYHALGLLLPDGRVLTAGGNSPDRAFVNYQIEIYRPAYMSQPRPTINSAPQTAAYGGTITIGITKANNINIKWVSLIKPMATTHGLDTEQRLVDLPITSSSNNSLNATVTNNRNLAPPGYYMLFITDNNNVPSVAKWIRLA